MPGKISIIEHKWTRLALGIVSPLVLTLAGYIVTEKLKKIDRNFEEVKYAILIVDKNYRKYTDSILTVHKKEAEKVNEFIFSDLKSLHKDSISRDKIDQIYRFIKNDFSEYSKKKDLLTPIHQGDAICKDTIFISVTRLN